MKAEPQIISMVFSIKYVANMFVIRSSLRVVVVLVELLVI